MVHPGSQPSLILLCAKEQLIRADAGGLMSSLMEPQAPGRHRWPEEDRNISRTRTWAAGERKACRMITGGHVNYSWLNQAAATTRALTEAQQTRASAPLRGSPVCLGTRARRLIEHHRRRRAAAWCAEGDFKRSCPISPRRLPASMWSHGLLLRRQRTGDLSKREDAWNRSIAHSQLENYKDRVHVQYIWF